MLYDPKYGLDGVGKLLWQAADLLEECGWCQHRIEDDYGRMCLVGSIQAALRMSQRADPVFCHAVVYRLKRRLELPVQWNDQPERTQEQVVDMLRELARETD